LFFDAEGFEYLDRLCAMEGFCQHQRGRAILILIWRETHLRVLWVENHVRFTEVALPMFLQAHTVRIVPSLAEARQCLAEEAFDAVLLYYDLDDGKGTELVSLVLSLPKRPLLVAASSHLEGNTRLLQAGADVICGKTEFARIGEVLERSAMMWNADY
jgi:DNA-binding response OmpR family regulator